MEMNNEEIVMDSMSDSSDWSTSDDSDIDELLQDDDVEMMSLLIDVQSFEDRVKLMDQRRGSKMGRITIYRNRALGHEHLMEDYFAEVLLAIRSQGGEQALIQTLNRARDLYRQRSQPAPNIDELASLLAQCAIAEAQSSNPNPPGPGSDPVATLNSDEACILAECGRKQIILDAFNDGSSFICLKCGGLFSTSRKDEHLAYWCGAA